MRHPSLKLHMILSTNPVSIDNWVYLHFFKDEVNERIILDDEDLYEKHTVVVKDTYYHHSTADDNLFLPQSYIDELDETKEYDPDLHRVARYGKFGVNGVKVLPQFEMMNAEKMNDIIKNQHKLMLRIGMDFGLKHRLTQWYVWRLTMTRSTSTCIGSTTKTNRLIRKLQKI